MKSIFYGAVIAAAAATAPGLVLAQSVADGVQPYYGAVPAQPNAVYAAPQLWAGYQRTGSFPEVNRGQASASAHGPSYGGELSTERSH
jgi:hypothetical protein